MNLEGLEVSLEELNVFEYFLETDELTSWSEWNDLEAKFRLLFPEMVWYFRYTAKLASVKELLLMQVEAERSKRL